MPGSVQRRDTSAPSPLGDPKPNEVATVKHPHLQKVKDFFSRFSFFRMVANNLHLRRNVSVNPPIDTTKVQDLAHKSIKLPSGAIYDGTVDADNKPHGQGLLRTKEGHIYRGEIQNGKSHGTGYFEKSNGDRFVGKFDQGKFVSGFAVVKNQDGEEVKYLLENGQWTQAPEIKPPDSSNSV